MCTKLRGSKTTPGQVQSFLTRMGKASGVWGFEDGLKPNARIESLSIVWSTIFVNRGILSVESFWEKDAEFIRRDRKPFKLGVIYNGKMEFAVITVPANGIVSEFHHRMPAYIADECVEDFLEDGLIVLMHPDTIQLQISSAA